MSKAEKFYRSHKKAPLASVDGVVSISEKDLIGLMEEYKNTEQEEVKYRNEVIRHLADGGDVVDIPKPQQQSSVQEDYKLQEEFCELVELMDGKPTADNVRGSMTAKWAIEFFKMKRKNTLNQDKDTETALFNFIKSKGLRTEWDYWLDCWENKKPYDPEKFNQDIREAVLAWCKSTKVITDEKLRFYKSSYSICEKHAIQFPNVDYKPDIAMYRFAEEQLLTVVGFIDKLEKALK